MKRYFLNTCRYGFHGVPESLYETLEMLRISFRFNVYDNTMNQNDTMIKSHSPENKKFMNSIPYYLEFEILFLKKPFIYYTGLRPYNDNC